jgi:hypothetical protein
VLRLRSADALRLHEQTDSRHRVDQGLPPLTERALSSRLFGAYTSGGKLRHAQCHRHGLGPDCRTVRRAGAGGTLARSRRKLLSFWINMPTLSRVWRCATQLNTLIKSCGVII